MTTIVIATRNAHKVQEIRAILGAGFLCRSLAELSGAPEVVEDADTFEGNARKKALALASWIARGETDHRPADQLFVLADDSGLEVDALHGAPGVHSARFASLDPDKSGNSPDVDNNAKLLRLLAGVPEQKRTARFRCVLALTPVLASSADTTSPAGFMSEADVHTEMFNGACEGRIAFAASGKGGFGYDPLFIPEGYDESFAALSEEVKNRVSHRACALEILRTRFAGRSERH